MSGKNAPYGAPINYWLKEPVKKESSEEAEEDAAAKNPFDSPKKKPVEITILDASGQKVRTLAGTNTAGINRVAWDLRYEPTDEVRLRTTPKGNSAHLGGEALSSARTTAASTTTASTRRKRGPLAAPGTYTVKLTVDGKESTQKLVVRKDPNSAGTDADVEASTKFSLTLYTATSTRRPR